MDSNKVTNDDEIEVLKDYNNTEKNIDNGNTTIDFNVVNSGVGNSTMNSDNVVNSNTIFSNSIIGVSNSFDDELIAKYIGPDYEKIKVGGFNIFGALFGSLYFFYHKMYFVGFILVFINCILNVFFPQLVSNFLYIVIIFAIFGIITNPLRLYSAKSVVSNLKQKNPQSTKEELLSLSFKEGLGGFSSLLVGVIGTVVFSCVFYIVCALFGYPIKTGVEFVDNIFNNISSLTSNDEIRQDNNIKENESNTTVETFDIGGNSAGYEQVLNVPDVWDDINISFNTDSSIAINYPITFPSNFKRVSGSPYLYDYVDFNDTPNDFCRLFFVEIISPTSFENIRNTMDEYILSNDDFPNYAATNINGDVNIGFVAQYTYEDKKYYSLFANLSGRKYLYEIISSGNYDINVCMQYANSSLNNS